MADATPSADCNFQKTKVVKPHHASDDTQLELRLNDIVYVLEQDDSGWWGGHKEGEDCTGWFPGSCVREVFEEEPCVTLPEPSAEPQPEHHRDTGLCVVHEETSAAGQIQKACKDGLDLDAQDPLHHGNRMVASPNRRVSGCSNAAPINDSATALASLQVEYKNAMAINEEHESEIRTLRKQVADAKVWEDELKTSLINAKEERAADAHWRIEELQRQCQSFKKEKDELQRTVQELTEENQARASAALVENRRADGLQTQLMKSQQETRACMDECAQLRRRLHEKEADLAKALEKQAARPAQEPVREQPAKQFPQREPKTPSADDARRRLFPSTADHTIVAGMVPTEKDVSRSILDATAEEVSNVSATMETVPRVSERLNAFRALPQPPAGRSPAPTGSMPPRSARSNSLTRPAFRPSPSAASSMMMSPGGLNKCLSTGDLPPTPRRIDGIESEVPPVGSVKEMTKLFEQRCGTPSRDGRRPNTDSELSFRSHTLPPGQRSPMTEQRLRENPQQARSTSRPPMKSTEMTGPFRTQPLQGLDMQEAEDPAEFPVNFNMSPMKRHA